MCKGALASVLDGAAAILHLPPVTGTWAQHALSLQRSAEVSRTIVRAAAIICLSSSASGGQKKTRPPADLWRH